MSYFCYHFHCNFSFILRIFKSILLDSQTFLVWEDSVFSFVKNVCFILLCLENTRVFSLLKLLRPLLCSICGPSFFQVHFRKKHIISIFVGFSEFDNQVRFVNMVQFFLYIYIICD